MSAPRTVAWAYGLACHFVFAVALAAMVGGIYTGLTHGLGRVGRPFSFVADAALIGGFIGLLSRRGRRLLVHLAPPPLGRDLSTTTYALVSSVALLLLFSLWTPSGIVWWRATGATRALVTVVYAGAWLFLARALYDAGLGLQIGHLGWRAVARGRCPVYPPMPERGLFRVVRQPIYLGFSLTLWTTPTWTPDQLLLATTLTTYCLLAPRWKEARFAAIYGDALRRYQARVPYFLPLGRRT